MPIANAKPDLVPSVDLINLGKVDKRMWALFAPLVWSSVEICKCQICAAQGEAHPDLSISGIDLAEDDFDLQFAKLKGPNAQKCQFLSCSMLSSL